MHTPTLHRAVFSSRVRAPRAPLTRALLALLLLACVALALAPPTPVRAATRTVTNTLDDGSAGSLRTVLAGAASGDTITFDPTAFATAQTITLLAGSGGTLTPTHNVTIDGTGYRVTISGGGSVQLFVVNSGITLTLKALTLANGKDTPTSGGGAIYNFGGTVQVMGCTFSGNASSFGGAIDNDSGTLTVTNSAFSNNTALNYGGAIWNNGSTVTVTGSSFSTNTATNGAGGAINNNNGTLNVTGSAFSGNAAPGGVGNGGAIVNSAGMNVTGSSFSTNTASNYGGAIFNNGGATVQVTNSAFNTNTASNYGGAIYNGGATKVTGSTLSGNAATSGNGGALHNVNGALTLALSVVAGNSASGSGPDLFSTSTSSSGGNVIGKTDGATFTAQPTDKTGTVAAPLDAKLAPFGNYGGTTLTFALLPGSPAIDLLTPCPIDPITTTTLVTDQRSVTRPQGSACDSGSYESRGFTFSAPTGGGQSAVVTTTFAQPLAVTLSETGGAPLPGAVVTFTIVPGMGGASGASATFTSPGAICTLSMGNTVAVCPGNGSGVATSPTVKAGLNTGSFTVIGSTVGAPVAGNVTYTLTNTSSAGLITPQPRREPNGTSTVGPQGTPAPQPTPRPTAPGTPAGTIAPQPTRH